MNYVFLIVGVILFFITYSNNYSSDTSIFWVMNIAWFVCIGLGLSLKSKQ